MLAMAEDGGGALSDEQSAPMSALEQVEEELRRPVEGWLDAMVRHQLEANDKQKETDAAQSRYRAQLDDMSRLYERMRVEHGRTMDLAKPYFDASHDATTALQRARDMAREFSGAASEHARAKEELRAVEEKLEVWSSSQASLSCEQQEAISHVTERLLRCQGERGAREQRHAAALRDYTEAQRVADAWRGEVGEAAVRAAEPCFRQLKQCQAQLTSEQARITVLEGQARSARRAHRHAMEELERISEAVHRARRDAAESGGGDGADAKAAPETAPKAAPEIVSKAAPETHGGDGADAKAAPETASDDAPEVTGTDVAANVPAAA